MRRTILGGACAIAAIFACSGDSSSATGIVLGLQLDLAVPTDTDHVAVLVSLIQGNRRTTQAPASLTPINNSGVTFVATLVLESHEPDDRVQVRFIAFDAAGNVRAMREALTRVPQEGTALLRMPLLWINDGLVQDSGSGPLASGAGDLAFASASVATQTLTDDGFARLSMVGCAAEETRGNDGACRPIAADGDLEPLANSSVTVDPGPCMDVQTCFTGPEVRRFDLAALSNCDLPIDTVADTPKPALAFTGPSTGGFPVVQDNATEQVRPGDDALYTYLPDRHVVHLNDALCAKVARDHIPTAIVSAKCAPKKTDTLVCADYNASNGPVAPGAGVFVDVPDGGPGPADAGLDATDGDAAVAPRIINETVTIPEPYVYSFAARNTDDGAAGNIWLFARPDAGNTALTRAWPNVSDDPIDVPPPSGFYYPYQGQMVIGARKRAYLLAENPSEGSHSYGLGDGTGMPSERVKVCPATTCGPAGGCANPGFPDYFSAGEQGAVTGGIYVTSINAGAPVVAGSGLFALTGTAGCFESRPSDTDASTFLMQAYVNTLSPGIAYGDAYMAALNVDDVNGTQYTQLVRSTDTSATYATRGNARLIGAFGPNRAITTTTVNVQGDSTTTFDVIEPNLAIGASVAKPWGDPHELFGGPNVACVRVAKDFTYSYFVACARQEGAALETVLPTLDGTTYIDGNGEVIPFDPHVYADLDYLYIGQVCSQTEFKMRGVPWSLLQSAGQLKDAFAGICGGVVDGGLTPQVTGASARAGASR